MRPVVPPEPGDTAVRLIGRLTKRPEWHGLGVYLDMQALSIDEQTAAGRARLVEFLDDAELRALFDSLDLGSGDRVEILVRLHRPGVYRNPGVFDYRDYLERQGIYWTGTIRNPRLIKVLNRGWHGTDRIKEWITARLEAPFAARPDIQGLVLGTTLGRKFGLTPEIERQFQSSGLYHLVVVSGFNLAVVAGAALFLARLVPCKRRTRLLFVLICTFIYAAVVEGQAPVYRATLAVTFLVVGKMMDRGYAVLNATAGTAFILLFAEPVTLQDSSFQMTFSAVLAVVGIGAPAINWLLGWLREALQDFPDTSKDGEISIVALDWRISRRVWCERYALPYWVVIIPWKIALICGEALVIACCVESVFSFFMVESFHRLSPISPLMNVPAAMIAAAVTPLGLLLSLAPSTLAMIIGRVITILFDILLKLVGLALQIPGSSLRVPSPPLWLWFLYALILLVLITSIQRRKAVMCILASSLVVALQAAIAFVDLSPPPPTKVTITFLDVGQGDSIFIEFPTGYRMLVDGGGVAAGRFLDLRDESSFSIGENVVSSYLFARGIRRLDAVVLTHAHHDHMDGLFDVIQNFQIGTVWLGRNPGIERYLQLLDRIQQKQIPIRWVSAGQSIGPFKVLHPPADWKPRKNDQNNDSVVLLLDTGKATALLTGDIERSIAVPERVDVLKVSHHGSKGVRVRPKTSVPVISVGANNPFGHPHPQSLPALRTDQLGAITVTLASTEDLGRPPIWGVTGTLTETCCSCKLAMFFGATIHKDLKNLRLSGF